MHDAIVQTPPQLDPSQWSGNQRVVHFGPMAQRDPFYYYYPKGWDILYPAHFGFFPYRTNKFRGSSPTVCLTAFGVFFAIGGAIMTTLGYVTLARTEEDEDDDSAAFRAIGNPLQITGPVLLVLGAISLFAGATWWLCSLQLCSEHLRHTQPHHASTRRKVVHQAPLYDDRQLPQRNVNDKSPYSPPPPPPIPVLQNVHTETALYKHRGEMKLFPPVIPGATSTLSLARNSPHTGSAYGTLSGRGGGSRSHATVYENWSNASMRM